MRIAVQMDLARQKETLSFIREHIDFLAEQGYTHLLLYLEGGVRTESFAFADPEKSYSPEEMREIVSYAAGKNLEIIPGFNILGHCELFLRYPELDSISEHVPRRNTVCPSKPETTAFFRRYFTELADIFPCRYWHIGADEVFSLGSCPLCRKRLENGETHSDLFAKYVSGIIGIVRELGKIPQMWDDMADFFPEILNKLPAGTEMTFWEYLPVSEDKLTKYGNRRRVEIFDLYRRKNFPLTVAPRDENFSNIVTITRNALRKGDCTELLLTSWEHGKDFPYCRYPQTAFAGRWWSSGAERDPETVFEESTAALFGISDKVFLQAVRLYCMPAGEPDPLSGDPALFSFRKAPNALTLERRAEYRLMEAVFASFAPKLKDKRAQNTLKGMRNELEHQALNLDLRLWVNDCFRNGKIPPETAALRQRLEAFHQERLRLWQVFRTGLDDSCLRKDMTDALEAFDRVPSLAASKPARLEMTFLLPDYYGQETLRVQVRYDDGPWTNVYEGMPKPEGAERGDHPFYTEYALLDSADVTAVRIVASGDNGIGISGISVECGTKRFLPKKVTSSGLVSGPENLLIDDTSWCMMGNRDGMTSHWDKAMHDAEHTVELAF